MARKKLAPVDDVALPELAIPLPANGIGSEKWWNDEISDARERRKKELKGWKDELDAYRDSKKNDNQFNVNVNYSNTETKKNQLFFDNPDIQAEPRQLAVEPIAADYQDYLNCLLGEDYIDAKSLMDEVDFDLLVTAGIGATKIGYECVKVDGEIPEMVPDPSGEVDPMTGQRVMVQQMRTIPDAIEVFSEFYWKHIEAEKFLKPCGFFSMNHDEAPWLGWEFERDADRLAAQFKFSREDAAEPASDETLAADEDRQYVKRGPAVEIFYKASLIDPSVSNPMLYRRLVLIHTRGGKQSTVVHENCPYQRFNDKGQFDRGMVGNPLHVFSLRSVAMTPYPPSDCAMTRKLRKELSELFRIFKKQRQRSIPLRGFDKTGMDKTTVDQIRSGSQQEMIGFDGPPADKLVEIARAALSPETFEFVHTYRDELARMWALGSNQQGGKQEGQTTATESALIDKWIAARSSAERKRLMRQYVIGVKKLSGCVQLFAQPSHFVDVLGEQKAQKLIQWDKNGRFAFKLRPDSGVYVDAKEQQNQVLRKYNLLAADPFVNRPEILKSVALSFNDDPAKLVTQPPPKQSEPPKISVAFKGELPPNPVMLALLRSQGMEIPDDIFAQALAASLIPKPEPPPAVKAPKPEHPGAAEQTSPVNKHDSDLTGFLSGPGPH